MGRTVGNNPLLDFWKKYQKQVVAALIILALFVIGEIATGHFLSVDQFFLTVKVAALVAMFGLCQMICAASGASGLDLSVGYVATIAAIFAAKYMDGQNANLLAGLGVALLIGIAAGAVNGFFIAYLKLPALVITLAVSNIIQGIINVYTAGAKIDGQPSPVLVQLFARMTGVFPNILLPLAVIAVIAMVLIYKTKWGQELLAVGSNETTAYLCGINVKRVRFTAYVISGAFAAFTGVALLAYMNMAFKDMGSTYVMPSIAAVVVGGVSMAGGEGNYIGVILGAIVLQTLTNLFYALGLGEAGKWVGIGVVLLAVLIAYVREKKER